MKDCGRDGDGYVLENENGNGNQLFLLHGEEKWGHVLAQAT